MTSLTILSAITGFSCYLLTREVQRTHTTETAVFLLIMIFLYYRLHSGITMSENFGIAIGSLGFALLWRGADKKNLSLICLGILSTTLALNARAGAFFVLPFLVIWASWLFYTNKVIRWKAIGVACTAIVVGFGLNLILGRIIGSPDGIPFSNFSYSLYSLAEGGKSWAYIAETHPEVLSMQDPERTKRIFQLAFELMQDKPLQTVKGAIFFWKAIFTDTLYNVFAFVAKENWVIDPIIKWGLYFLSMVGVISWIRDKKSPFASLITLCAIGIFISIPLAPPTDSFRMRPYAASIAMISILPSFGFGYLASKLRSIYKQKEVKFNNFDLGNLTSIITTLLLTFILITPVIIKFTSSKPQSPRIKACNSTTYPIVIRFNRGTFINLRKNKDDFLDWAPNYHMYLFQKNTHSIENEHLINWLEIIPSSQTLLIALDLLTDKGLFITIPTEIVPKNGGYYQICGDHEKNPNLENYNIFYGKEIIPISLE